MIGARESFKTLLKNAVQEYLKNGEYSFWLFSDEKARAERYEDRIDKQEDENVEKMVVTDFLTIEKGSPLETDTMLRLRIGHVICEKKGLAEEFKACMAKYVYPKGKTPQEEVKVITDILRNKLKEERNIERLKRIEEFLAHKDSRHDSLSYLHQAIQVADQKYYEEVRRGQSLQTLLKQAVFALKDQKINKPEIVIQAIVLDYEHRITQEAKKRALEGKALMEQLKTNSERIEFSLTVNLRASGFDIEELWKDLCDFSEIFPVRKLAM